MRKITTRAAALAVGLLAGVPMIGAVGYTFGNVTPAQAETTTPPQRPDMRSQRMSPEVRQRLFEGRLAMMKTALAIKPGQQEQLWANFEKVLRDGAAARQKMMTERTGERRDESTLDPAARLERRAAAMEAAAGHMKQLAAVIKPLYDSFDDNQKSVARALLARGEWRHHGHHAHGHDRPGAEQPRR